MSSVKKFFLSAVFFAGLAYQSFAQQKPNVIFIYADDLGYGDLSCYGATKISTPNVDKLANTGVRFTNAHCTSATCTPSRYAVMTGQYPWRVQGIRVLPGDARLIIPQDKITLPKVFKNAGYNTAIIGKWHLGLGETVEKDWNGDVTPGPNEVGFNYAFIFPATADRVPTVFLENHKVVALDPADPISVNYSQKVGNDPTGKDNPELLKMQSTPGQGHNQTIVNGIGRIGYMSGGKMARWVDEEVSSTFLAKAEEYIEQNQKQPFFMALHLTEPHVPRMPATRFKGKSGLGVRGDAILQLDWTVGQIMKKLEALQLDKKTIIVFSSDNGPVLDDGYQDEAVTKINGHKQAGALRGGKYSSLEGGTRVPFIVNWPGKTKAKVSDALVSQMDLLASFSALLKQDIPANEATDSQNTLDAFLGKKAIGRSSLVEQGLVPNAIIQNDWKLIQATNGTAYMSAVGIETGNSKDVQLFHLKEDIGEKNNLAQKYPEKVKELEQLLNVIKTKK
ncbi:sulfatase family protein [Pedobacter sp. MW01-1-1]|uniref:sulfatase family protein n=1 Tax=Pedobacter sp. MW01-1-1 TaxID=3383027 RepID=UPI003FF14AF5